MSSTPVTLLFKRTGNAADRPSGATVQTGEPAICFGAADPGLYFKDSAGSIRKVGGSAYAASAPNSTPVGSPGNSTGEIWVDSSTSEKYLKVWNGAAWDKVGAAFADTSATATVPFASGAAYADSALVASGAFGAIMASGVITATGVPVADIYTGALTGTGPSGSFRYKADDTGSPSGIYVAYAGGWALT